MRINLIVAWYDMWVGVYWDRERRRLYVLPLPCVGVVIQLGTGTHLPNLFKEANDE